MLSCTGRKYLADVRAGGYLSLGGSGNSHFWRDLAATSKKMIFYYNMKQTKKELRHRPELLFGKNTLTTSTILSKTKIKV